MRKLLVATVLLACSFVASADSLTIEWEAPTTREDGTPLAEAEIAAFAIERAPSCAGPFSLQVGNIAKTIRSHTFASVQPGTACYRVVTIDTRGQRSTNAPAQEHTVAAPPAPPSGAEITSITSGP